MGKALLVFLAMVASHNEVSCHKEEEVESGKKEKHDVMHWCVNKTTRGACILNRYVFWSIWVFKLSLRLMTDTANISYLHIQWRQAF